jgi:hypothetical protein
LIIKLPASARRLCYHSERRKTEKAMTGHVSALAAAALLTASIALFAEPASAAAFSEALAIKKAAASDVETVRWGGGGRGWRGSVGVVADVAAPASVRAYWVERSLVER